MDDAATSPDTAPSLVATGGQVRGVPYRWVAMFVVLFGSFMVVLDTTVVNLGLPSLQRSFGVTDGVEWVVTAYLAAVGVAHSVSGWSADRYGRVRVFTGAMALFTLASLLCAASATFEMLVVARVLQGLAGGLMLPAGMTMIYELFEPSERGRALGWFGITIMAAPALGPILGGTLITSLSWRWLFLVNIPIGVVGVPLAHRLLHDTGHRDPSPLDRTGLALSSVGLVSFLVGMSQGGIWGWTEPATVALLTVGVAGLGAFVAHARRCERPLVELDILTEPVFALGMVAVSLLTVAQFSRLVYIPLELGRLRGVSEIRIGLVMLPAALGMAATMPIGGRLVDRVGARIPVTVGAGLMAVSFLGLSQLDLTSSLPTVSALLLLGGLGSGLAMMAPNIVAMNSVETRRIAQASALSNVTRQVAAAVGVASLTAVFTSARSSAGASDALWPYEVVFLVATALLVVTVGVAQFLPGRRGAIALQDARAAEWTGRASTPAPQLVEGA